MERAGFKCEMCKDKENTLHIHHSYYEHNKEPWEYENDTLFCLCKDCHEYIKEEIKSLYYETRRIKPDILTGLIDTIRIVRQYDLEMFPEVLEIFDLLKNKNYYEIKEIVEFIKKIGGENKI